MKSKINIVCVIAVMLVHAGCIRIHESVRTQREPLVQDKVETFESVTSDTTQLVTTFDREKLNISLQQKKVYDTYEKQSVLVTTTTERSMYNANGKWCFEGSDRCNGDKGGYYCAFFVPWYTPIMLVNAVALPFRTMDSENETIIHPPKRIAGTRRNVVTNIKPFEVELTTVSSTGEGRKTMKLAGDDNGVIAYPIDKVVSFLGMNEPQIQMTAKVYDGTTYHGTMNLAGFQEVTSKNSYRRYVQAREYEKRRLERLALLQERKKEQEQIRFQQNQKRRLQRALNNKWMAVVGKCIRPSEQPRNWIKTCNCNAPTDERGWLWLYSCDNGAGGTFQLLFTPTYQECIKSVNMFEQRKGKFYRR